MFQPEHNHIQRVVLVFQSECPGISVERYNSSGKAWTLTSVDGAMMLQTGHRLLRSAYGGRATRCSQAVASPCPQSHKPSIIFQHPELLAINKPPGLPFHSRDGVVGVIPTLRHMEAANEIPQLGPLYPLHRCQFVVYLACDAAGCHVCDNCHAYIPQQRPL